MSGAYGEVQKFIHEKQPYACYVHCAAHNLNLVVNDALFRVCEVQDCFPLTRICMHSLDTVYADGI